MKIGIIGFGTFGQFLAKTFKQQGHSVIATSRTDYSDIANKLEVEFFGDTNEFCQQQMDCIILAMSIVSMEAVVKSLPLEQFSSCLLVDVLSVKTYPKEFLKHILPQDVDILCTHPMFGPDSGADNWQDLPMVYDKVRIRNTAVCDDFLQIFASAGCHMIEQSCEEHDEQSASSQFLTHTTGRILSRLNLQANKISTHGYTTLLDLIENTCHDSFDLYYGLFEHNINSRAELLKVEQALRNLKNQLLDRSAQERNSTLIGVQGGEGSFSHLASLELIKKYNYNNAELRFMISSETVLKSLNTGDIDYAVFAIENSASGTVIPSIYSMSKYAHEIVEIHNMPLTQCLLTRPGQDINKATKIITHPQAIKQCHANLKTNYPQLTWDYLSDDYDTAECAKSLSQGKFADDVVVIASAIAGEKYGLDCIHSGLNDDPENATDFIFCKRRHI